MMVDNNLIALKINNPSNYDMCNCRCRTVPNPKDMREQVKLTMTELFVRIVLLVFNRHIHFVKTEKEYYVIEDILVDDHHTFESTSIMC